jgi:hypothetical protein
MIESSAIAGRHAQVKETAPHEQEETMDPQQAASALMKVINGYQIS